MIRTSVKLAAVALAMLAASCATKPRNEIQILVGPDGKMTVAAPPGASAEDQAMAALMAAALNGELDEEEDASAALSEDEVWRKDDNGNVTHIQSGANCPAVWSGMTRDRLSIFRPDGLDVGCNYTIAGAPVVMTFYVFQSEIGLEKEMEIAVDAMKARQPVAKETPFLMPSVNGAYRSYTLAYDTANGTAMRTSVLLAPEGVWLLKIRLTCTANGAAEWEQKAGLAIMGQADRLRTPRPPVAAPAPI